jgi:hypothetical protein
MKEAPQNIYRKRGYAEMKRVCEKKRKRKKERERKKEKERKRISMDL